jgi:HlyD family secretion protein
VTTRSKIIWGGVGLVLIAIIGSSVRGYLARGTVKVQTARAIRQDLVSVVTASGEIKPRNYINIGANSMGRITDIDVSEGDRVTAGQTLAKLETVQPAADVDSQKANLELTRAELVASAANIEANLAAQRTQQASLQRTEAELGRARINFDRAKELLEAGLIPRQDYDQRKADYESASAVVAEAQATLSQLKAQQKQLEAQRGSAGRRVEQAQAQLRRVSDVLQKHYAVSPIDGVVTNLPVRVGETVVPGIQNSSASLIMTIADMSLITAEIKVDETDIVNVELGQVADVGIDAEPDKRFAGRVIEIGNTAILRSTGVAASQSNVASQEAKDFKVVVALDNPPAGIRPGMSCTARITTATREKALTVPIQAVTVRMQSDLQEREDASGAQAAAIAPGDDREVEGVFVVRDQKVEFVPLRIGVTGASNVEVLEGVEEGAEIVTGSYQVLRTIRPGTNVVVENNVGGT